MTLRLRSLLTLTLSLGILMALLGIVSSSVIERGFERAEERSVLLNVERAREAIAMEIARLRTLADDWGNWAEVYAFLDGNDPDVPAREFRADVLDNIRIGQLLLFRADGSVAHATGYDRAQGRLTEPSRALFERLRPGAEPGLRTEGGLLMAERPWLFAGARVRDAGRSTEANGWLYMARPLDETLCARIEQLVRLPVSIVPFTPDRRGDLAPPVHRVLDTIQPGLPRCVRSEALAYGVDVLRDAAGRPALVLQVTAPRDIVALGRHSRGVLLLWILGCGIAIGLVVLLLQERLVMTRLQRLVRDVLRVRAQADFRGRVRARGADELGQLGEAINGMLGTLERVHHHLQEMNAQLEQRVSERTAELEASQLALAADAARRIAAEKANAEREKLYRTMFDLSPSGLLLEAEDGTILDVNEALCAAVGWSREDLVGSNVRKLAPPDELPQVERDIARLLDGEMLVHEIRNRRKDGSICLMELREKAIALPNGERRIMVAANNVTERRAAEERLRESERRYHTLFNTLITGFALHEVVCDEQGDPVDYVFLDVNPAFTAITGRRRDEVVGRRVTEVFPGTETEWIKRYGRVALTGKPEAFESFAATLNKHFSVIAYCPQPGQFAVNFVDITEQRRASAQLRLQSTALESAANGIMIVDRAGQITWVNRAFTVLTGYEPEEVVGRTPRVLKSGRHDDAFYRGMWDTIAAGRLWRGELVNRRKDGTLYLEEMMVTPVLGDDGSVSHFVAIKQDVSERRQLEQQLFQAQKMEGIGRLAGGIAHDFNNLLQAITGFSTLLLDELGPTSPHRQDVLEIEKAALRASELTRQLLAFSRRQMIEPRVLDLNTLVSQTEKMLRRLIGEDIQLATDLQPSLDPVRVDPGQIEQVLVNLTINARDAMPSGGRLTISTCGIVLLKEDTLLMPEARHGRFVCLALSDTGHGMSKQVMEHIFEPFFSTKGAGKGTGLGLSVVYGIIRQHEGMIHVYSQEGEGTTFRIYLPVHEAAGEPAAADASRDGAPDPSLRGHGECILLVEDEDGVRDFAARALRNYGYEVLLAASATEASEVFARESGRITALFSDVVLPDRTGLDLAEDLIACKPGLKLLFCSGYMDDKSRWPIIRDRGYRFLQKPYPVLDLLRVLRDVVQGR